MAEPKILISLRNIQKSFGAQTVLSGISLDIYEGEFLTLLGPSGCGKTTLLRMINGFDTPDSGSVLLDGVDQKPIPPNRRTVNTVFQSYALFPHLTVRENISYGLKMKHTPSKECRERVDEVLELTRLEALAERKPGQLSGGQQQRVAIARSLVNRPRVLLLDEPLGALDLKLRKQMQIELRRMQRDSGITYVYVTHDQEEALTLSDRIVVLNGGHIEQAGQSGELYYHPKTPFVASFLGESNFIPGPLAGEDANCQMAVRPEFLHLSAHGAEAASSAGRVRACTYLGLIYRVEVETAQGLSLVSLSERPYAPGQQVAWSWERDKAALLPAENETEMQGKGAGKA